MPVLALVPVLVLGQLEAPAQVRVAEPVLELSCVPVQALALAPVLVGLRLLMPVL